jgi:hypothetical protein
MIGDDGDDTYIVGEAGNVVEETVIGAWATTWSTAASEPTR